MTDDDLNRKDYLSAQAAMLAAETGIEVTATGDGDVEVDMRRSGVVWAGSDKPLLTPTQARLLACALAEVATEAESKRIG